jgi:ADP-ribosyl-[dinitrogen reductase] hydrolase
MQRTSDTHPILIDFIELKWGNSPARLGITFAPGKKQKDAMTGCWHRDLEKDIHRIADNYKIGTLVSMLEKWEMQELKIEQEFEECSKKGIKTYHYPVVDDSTPLDREKFQNLVKEVVDNSLMKGQSVVVHCKGGLGRAPTFVCACLLYSGKTMN